MGKTDFWERLAAEQRQRDFALAEFADKAEALAPGMGQAMLLSLYDKRLEALMVTQHREQGRDCAIPLDIVVDIAGLTPEATVDALLRIGAVHVGDDFWRLPSDVYDELDAEIPRLP